MAYIKNMNIFKQFSTKEIFPAPAAVPPPSQHHQQTVSKHNDDNVLINPYTSMMYTGDGMMNIGMNVLSHSVFNVVADISDQQPHQSTTIGHSSGGGHQSQDYVIQELQPQGGVVGPKPKRSKSNGPSKQFECETCFRRFNQKQTLKQHILTHTGQRPFECNVCFKTFTQQGALQRHMVIHTGEKPFACKYCALSFRQKINLHRHMKLHTGAPKEFVCRICSKEFSRKGALVRHLFVHDTNRPKLKCVCCNKDFLNRESLVRHEKNQELKEKGLELPRKRTSPNGCKPEKVVFKCSGCAKLYRRMQTVPVLQVDSSVTDLCLKCVSKKGGRVEKGSAGGVLRDVEIFQCSICKAVFQKENSYNKHQLLHCTSRQYECDICHLRFKEKRFIRGHMITHVDVCEHQCHMCGLNFKYASKLKGHYLTHMNEMSDISDVLRIFTCDACGRVFYQRNQLIRHLKVHEKRGGAGGERRDKSSVTINDKNRFSENRIELNEEKSNGTRNLWYEDNRMKSSTYGNETTNVSYGNDVNYDNVKNEYGKNGIDNVYGNGTDRLYDGNVNEVNEKSSYENRLNLEQYDNSNRRKRKMGSGNHTTSSSRTNVRKQFENVVVNDNENPYANELNLGSYENGSSKRANEKFEYGNLSLVRSDGKNNEYGCESDVKLYGNDRIAYGNQSNVSHGVFGGVNDLIEKSYERRTIEQLESSRPIESGSQTTSGSSEPVRKMCDRVDMCINVEPMIENVVKREAEKDLELLNESSLGSYEDLSFDNGCTETNDSGGFDHVEDSSSTIPKVSGALDVEECSSVGDLDRSKTHPFFCYICKKSYTKKRSLNRHFLVTHTNYDKFSCTICQKTFQTKNSLKQHSVLHLPHNFECKQCSKTFNRKDALASHELIHSKVKSFQCSYCPKSFFQKQSLHTHLIQHRGDKSYECGVCGKCFYERSTLNRHYLSHSGERKYSCHICTMSFIQKNHLDKHFLRHDEIEKKVRFECEACGKLFYRKDHYFRHKESHSENRTLYSCAKCEAKFTDKYSLARHVKYIRCEERKKVTKGVKKKGRVGSGNEEGKEDDLMET